jgi:hypothetical protein
VVDGWPRVLTTEEPEAIAAGFRGEAEADAGAADSIDGWTGPAQRNMHIRVLFRPIEALSRSAKEFVTAANRSRRCRAQLKSEV